MSKHLVDGGRAPDLRAPHADPAQHAHGERPAGPRPAAVRRSPVPVPVQHGRAGPRVVQS